MPIPKPRSDEKQNDFISRCMGDDVMNKEYPDQEQRAGVCYSQWRGKKKLKLETVEMEGAEIFEVGTWNGVKNTDKELDEMVENFNNGVLEPYLNINHSPNATEEFQEALKSMSLGFVKKLYRKGKKLIADFKQVPKTIAELIEAGALKQKSVEIWKKFTAGNGKKYRNVLEAVTFHGADGVPAISTLSDFIALYKSEIPAREGHETKEGLMCLDHKEEDIKVDEIKISKEEYDKLKNTETELNKFKADKKNNKMIETEKENAEQKEEIQKLKNEKAEADKKIKEADKFKADVEKGKKEALEKEAEDYIDAQIQAKKVMPASKELYKKDYIRLQEDEEMFKVFKNDIENRAELLPENIKEEDVSDEQDPLLLKNEKYLEDAIQKRMKLKNESWDKAREEILKQVEGV